ncbi:unnamed protein product [Parnassius apollo]|uniref:(apollo) hypothetical protein n=1 Tax=Parnassius apollo TaxID=110799 RepID=A0A8S3WQQ8_PARAO|nr:unnamed protein product [Parnassius apollo]
MDSSKSDYFQYKAAQLSNKGNILKSVNSQEQGSNQAQVVPLKVDSAFKHNLTPGPYRLPISTTLVTKLKEKVTKQKNKIKRLNEKN